MLNKEICKKCRLNHVYERFKNRVSCEFDRNWKRKWIECMCGKKINFRRINCNPPEDCPYLLEHTVNEDAK